MIAVRPASLLALTLLVIGCSYTPTPPSPLPSSGMQVLQGTVYPDGTTTVWAESPREGTFSLTVSEEKPAGVPIGVAIGGPVGAAGAAVPDAAVRFSNSSGPSFAIPVQTKLMAQQTAMMPSGATSHQAQHQHLWHNKSGTPA